VASCFHGRLPWIRLAAYPFDGDQERWELYRISDDFSQSRDLAEEYPEKLAELRELFEVEAARNGVYPMRDAGSSRGGDRQVPHTLGDLRAMTYTPAHVRMPESSVVNLKNSSSRVTADFTVGEAGGQGVLACQGGNMAGWSLYLDESGIPSYVYNCFGHEVTIVRGALALGSGRHRVEALYQHDGGFGAGGLVTLLVDGEAVGEARLERTVPIVFSMSGETFDVGVDTGAPVGPYRHGFECTAEIHGITLERLDEPTRSTRDQMRAGEHAAGLKAQ
jgi:arylsulfatase